MFPGRLAAAFPASCARAACAPEFATTHSGLAPGVSRGWHLDHVIVNVPDTLSLSKVGGYTDRADTLWRAQAPGDRRRQVERICRKAVRNGATALAGRDPVPIMTDVLKFSGTTGRVSGNIDDVGVNTIRFNMHIVDHRSGPVLAREKEMAADLPAPTGQAGIEAGADGAGTSERDRVVAYLSATIAGRLGPGPDPGVGFRRLGY